MLSSNKLNIQAVLVKSFTKEREHRWLWAMVCIIKKAEEQSGYLKVMTSKGRTDKINFIKRMKCKCSQQF